MATVCDSDTDGGGKDTVTAGSWHGSSPAREVVVVPRVVDVEVVGAAVVPIGVAVALHPAKPIRHASNPKRIVMVEMVGDRRRGAAPAAETESEINYKERASRAFESIENDLQSLSSWMYDNPEIGFEEFATSERIAAYLRSHGLAVTKPAYGLETAFTATVGGSGPEVIVCAEYDALPGVGHACGHNIIAAAAVGAVLALADLADELGVRVTILGTPAEEAYGGKVDLLNAGAFANASAAMMVHPSPIDVVDPGVLAVRHVDIEFHGKDSHAAFAPQLGINALDAFVQAYVNVSTLRQALYPTDEIHGIITHGGDAPNIIPSYTKSAWYIRAADRARLAELSARVEACFAAAALATGCSWDMTEHGHPYENLVSNPDLVELFKANAASLGRPMLRGTDFPPGASGSTDMGNVSHAVPSIHPFLSINCGPIVNHQPEFAAHTISPDGHRAIRDGALAMAMTVIDLAEQEKLPLELVGSTP